MSLIFDTHSHYDDPRFPDPDALVSSLFSGDVCGIIHASTDPKSAEFGLMMSKKYPRYYTSVGIHPEYASEYSLDSLSHLGEIALGSKKVVAVGEIGLDYHYEGYDRAAQIELFRAQIEMANSLGLPIIVHSRDATGDCVGILRELRPRGVMHCFSGSWETAKEILSLGMYLGFTGALTFKNSKRAQEVVQKMPGDRLLFETDCPYMAPELFRGKTSDSAMIKYTAAKAAELRGTDTDSILLAARENAERLFAVAVDAQK